MTTKRIAVKDLYAGSIDAVSAPVEDWKDLFKAYFEEGDGNQFWEAQECDKCGTVHVFHMGGGNERHEVTLPDSECDGHFSMSEGPMMNYWYAIDFDPHDFDPDEAAAKIVDLPLCVVMIGGQYGLALTGGGMDFSWEICEAYTRLGQLPPAVFADLPGMAGRGTSARDKYIMSACRATLNVRILRAQNSLRSLRGTRHHG